MAAKTIYPLKDLAVGQRLFIPKPEHRTSRQHSVYIGGVVWAFGKRNPELHYKFCVMTDTVDAVVGATIMRVE